METWVFWVIIGGGLLLIVVSVSCVVVQTQSSDSVRGCDVRCKLDTERLQMTARNLMLETNVSEGLNHRAMRMSL
ncbi:hypothetical protein E2C01_051119 [Portunus trituberculatus]|uniref:Uncharacterized protein n=1 Tax=Portunus trituberculatus TaxID=210409 RepID=A0A5B7GIA9_PORTR|nr:hypothetical protein [Portunus trituberculatus]